MNQKIEYFADGDGLVEVPLRRKCTGTSASNVYEWTLLSGEKVWGSVYLGRVDRLLCSAKVNWLAVGPQTFALLLPHDIYLDCWRSALTANITSVKAIQRGSGSYANMFTIGVCHVCFINKGRKVRMKCDWLVVGRAFRPGFNFPPRPGGADAE